MATRRQPEARIPKWTKHVVPEVGGRDPLGLSRVSFLITDYLLTGIITTTSRARYYSFYPWVLLDIETTENPKRHSDFVAAFQRREAFMSLGTLERNPNAKVVGIDALRPRLAKYRATKIVDTNFRVLPSNAMGGFGQYYGGSLYVLGLTHRPEGGFDRVAPGTGYALAEAFQHAIELSPYYQGGYFTKDEFPFRVLEKSSMRFSLDMLGAGFANSEKKLLRELLFSWDHGGLSDSDLLRRHSLTLVLHSVATRNRLGYAPLVEDCDKQLVYQPYYYRVLQVPGKSPASYEPPKQLTLCLGFWRVFCVHEFLTQALEFILYGVLEAIAMNTHGMTIEDLCDALLGAAFRSALGNSFTKAGTPADLLSSMGVQNVPVEANRFKARSQMNSTSGCSEWDLLNLDDGSPQVAIAVGVALLGILYSKWRGANDEFIRYIGSRANDSLWAGNVLPALDRWLDATVTWHNAVRELIEQFILVQHDRVMYEKGRLESCWLRRVEGRILKDQEYRPVFRSSRHGNCVSILSDLGLLRISARGEISIAPDGRQMLARVLRANGQK